MEYEVGKKYVRPNDKYPHTFLAASSRGYLVWENKNGGIWTETVQLFNWKEYKESVVHTRYVHWYRVNKTGAIGTYIKHTDTPLSYALNNWATPIKIDKIEYVEG